jgi:hypothetical protein
VILKPTSTSEVKTDISAKPPLTSDEFATMIDVFLKSMMISIDKKFDKIYKF